MEHKNACKNIYFEKQDSGASCGRHALNNLYGGNYFTACKGNKNFANAKEYNFLEIGNFKKSYKNINKLKNNKPKINLTKMAKFFHTNDIGSRSNEPLATENYSLTLIKQVLALIGGYTAEKVIIYNANNGVSQEGVYNIHGEQIFFNLLDYNSNSDKELGYLIATGGHYSVVKKCDNELILLDSINTKPIKMTEDEFKKDYKSLLQFTSNKLSNNKNQIGVFLIHKESPKLLPNAQANSAEQLNATIKKVTDEISNIDQVILKKICQTLGAKKVEEILLLINTIPNYNTLTSKQKEKLLYKESIIEQDNILKQQSKKTNWNSIESEINLNKLNIIKLKTLANLMTKSNFKKNIIRNKIIQNYKNIPYIPVPIGPGKGQNTTNSNTTEILKNKETLKKLVIHLQKHNIKDENKNILNKINFNNNYNTIVKKILPIIFTQNELLELNQTKMPEFIDALYSFYTKETNSNNNIKEISKNKETLKKLVIHLQEHNIKDENKNILNKINFNNNYNTIVKKILPIIFTQNELLELNQTKMPEFIDALYSFYTKETNSNNNINTKETLKNKEQELKEQENTKILKKINIKSKINTFNITKFNIFNGIPISQKEKLKIEAYYNNLNSNEKQIFNLIIFINNKNQIGTLMDKINNNTKNINLNPILYHSFRENICKGDQNCENILDEIFIINKKITNDVSKKIYNIYINNIYKIIEDILFDLAKDIKKKQNNGKIMSFNNLKNLMSKTKEQIIDIINENSAKKKMVPNNNTSKLNKSIGQIIRTTNNSSQEKQNNSIPSNFNQLKLGDKLIMHSIIFDKENGIHKPKKTYVILWKKVQCHKYLFGVVAYNNSEKKPISTFVSPNNFNNTKTMPYFEFLSRSSNFKVENMIKVEDRNYIPVGIKNYCEGSEIKDISSGATPSRSVSTGSVSIPVGSGTRPGSRTGTKNNNIKSKINSFNITKFNTLNGKLLETNEKLKIKNYYDKLLPLEQQKFKLILFINEVNQIKQLIHKINNPSYKNISLNPILYYSFIENMCNGDINCKYILDEILLINKINDDLSKKIINIYISNNYKNIKNILLNFAKNYFGKRNNGTIMSTNNLKKLRSNTKQQIIDIINKK